MKLLPLTLFLCAVAAAQDSYYAGPGLFSTRPSESKSLQTIDRFGPVGISVELHQPAFVMKVGKVEPGSPSDGVLAPGQVIESINGQALADIDVAGDFDVSGTPGVDGTDGEHPRHTAVTGCTAREVGLYEKQSSFFVQVWGEG